MQNYRRITMGLTATVGALLLVSGCTTVKDHRGYIIDQSLVESIQPGIDNRASVERTLGRPTFESQFGEPMWYYVSQDTRQTSFQNARTKEQTVLRLRFDNAGNLVGVDRTGMETVAHINPNGHKTPTMGRDRSFLEDLFGNIGSVGSGGLGGPAQ